MRVKERGGQQDDRVRLQNSGHGRFDIIGAAQYNSFDAKKVKGVVCLFAI